MLQAAQCAAPRPAAISVIIPTLNEESELPGLFASLQPTRPGAEWIVADGGSSDRTCLIARQHGARLCRSEPGRGSQLRAGASLAAGDILWFLHADARPLPEAADSIQTAMGERDRLGGAFRISFCGGSRGARFLNVLYPRLLWIGLCYGDSGFFVRRAAYAAAGGFRGYPLFEDLDFFRRVRRRGRFEPIAARLPVSSRRFEGRSFAPVFARWAALQALYWLGLSPTLLARAYPHSRNPTRSLPRR